MPDAEGCIEVHLYVSGGEWGLFVYQPGLGDRPSYYWPPGNPLPTQARRAQVLRKLGYEVVSHWVWKESPLQPERHSLAAAAHVRPLAAPAPGGRHAAPAGEQEAVSA